MLAACQPNDTAPKRSTSSAQIMAVCNSQFSNYPCYRSVCPAKGVYEVVVLPGGLAAYKGHYYNQDGTYALDDKCMIVMNWPQVYGI